MAKQKHNWTAIKRDYYEGKYKTLKELGIAYNVPGSYLRKKAANWDREDPEFITDLDIEEAEFNLNIPEDRKEKVRVMYDKLSVIAFKALGDMDRNFFTEDGRIKSKSFLDIASVVEKIQKGYETGEDAKQTGQLGQYASAIARLREQHNLTKEVDKVEEE